MWSSLEKVDFTISIARVFELKLRLKSAMLEKLVLSSGKLFQVSAARWLKYSSAL